MSVPTSTVNAKSWASVCGVGVAPSSNSSSSPASACGRPAPAVYGLTSQTLFAARANMTFNTKGADAFKSTNNPILDLFTETRKKVPETVDEFKILVRKIEAAKNYDSEMFVKLLKFHRLIEKGNGLKGIYYICMMILKDEDPTIYEQVLTWSRQYPKDILRLARLSSMLGSGPSTTGTISTIPMSLKYATSQGKSKGTLGKKMTKWALTEKKNTNLTSSRSQTNPVQTIYLSAEIELYAQLLADTLKKIMTGKLFDDEVNLMLFKYLSYETGHFAVESKVIWTRVNAILTTDPVVKAALDAFNLTQTADVA